MPARSADTGPSTPASSATWLDKLEVNPLADIKFDCAGFFGNQCGTPNPEWRHKARVGFTFRNGIGISAQWRYFSEVDVDAVEQ